MKSSPIGAVSGCVVWIVMFGILGSCTLPVAMMVGGFTSASNYALRTLGPILCPNGTTAELHSYATTTTDEYGNSQPSTVYELYCVDANGVILKKDPILYAFLWNGMMSVIGLVIAALLAFALAAPAGVIVTKLLNRGQGSNSTATIEPL